MKQSIVQIMLGQRTKPEPVQNVNLSGKTVIVVGSNTRIGLEAVKHFARMKATRIIIACRSENKEKAAVEAVQKDTGFAPDLWIIDLSQFSSVIAFVDRFTKDGGRLDYLVMNAAIATMAYEASPDAWESTLQVNHLSTALLSLLLLPTLIKAAKETSSTPRLVIVSSDVHYMTSISKKVQESDNILIRLSSEAHCTTGVMLDRYQLSKLLNVMFTRALNDRISASSPVIIDTVNPGYCISELRRSLPLPINILDWFTERLFAHTSEQGSRQLVYATVAGEGDMRGQFISSTRIPEPSDFVISEEGKQVQNRLWLETIEVLTKVSPDVQTIVNTYMTKP